MVAMWIGEWSASAMVGGALRGASGDCVERGRSEREARATQPLSRGPSSYMVVLRHDAVSSKVDVEETSRRTRSTTTTGRSREIGCAEPPNARYAYEFDRS